MSKSSDEKKQLAQTKAIMGKLASMPHKPHVKKGKPKKQTRQSKA